MQEYRYLIRNSITGSIFLKCKTFEDAQSNVDRIYETRKKELRLLTGRDFEKERAYDIIDLENIPNP